MDHTTQLTIARAARLYGISERALRSRIERGVLASHTQDGYHRLVDPEDIAVWQDRRRRQPGQNRRGENARRVVALHGEGYSDRRIAATIGISYQRVSQLRQAAGLPRLSRAALGNTCRRCGVRFWTEKAGQNRCEEHRRNPAERIDLTCRVCSNPFTRRVSTIRANSPGNYCSRACRDQAKRGRNRRDAVPKTCTECGSEYMGLASAKRSVCYSCRQTTRQQKAR